MWKRPRRAAQKLMRPFCGEFTNEYLETVIGHFPPKHQVVIRERLMNGRTLKETGEKINSNRERVRQIEAKVLRQLRLQTMPTD